MGVLMAPCGIFRPCHNKRRRNYFLHQIHHIAVYVINHGLSFMWALFVKWCLDALFYITNHSHLFPETPFNVYLMKGAHKNKRLCRWCALSRIARRAEIRLDMNRIPAYPYLYLFYLTNININMDIIWIQKFIFILILNGYEYNSDTRSMDIITDII